MKNIDNFIFIERKKKIYKDKKHFMHSKISYLHRIFFPFTPNLKINKKLMKSMIRNNKFNTFLINRTFDISIEPFSIRFKLEISFKNQ